MVILNEKKKNNMSYLSMLELKLVVNKMVISMMNKMVKNVDKKKEWETQEEILKKREEKLKKDYKLNASKKLLPEFRRK